MAVTCDDFRAAMADANGVDLQDFGRWYGQSGTPELAASGRYDAKARTYTLTLGQRTPPTHDQAKKQVLVIPVAVGLLSRDGRELAFQLSGHDAPAGTSQLLVLKEKQEDFVFNNVDESPIPSLLRGFSAPVKLEFPYTSSELAVLMAHDSDSFVRWEAAQLLAQRQILAVVDCLAAGSEPVLRAELLEAFSALLADRESDPALVAEALTLPGEDYLADQMDEVDVDGIHAARKFIKSRLANSLEDAFLKRYESLTATGPYSKAPSEMARRSLRNVCLSYLMQTGLGASLAESQLESSDNMTDTLAALQGLVWSEAASSEKALQAFEEKWRDDALVMDKWFSIQASIPGDRTVDRVRALLDHPGFTIANPNKVRALLGVFSTMNPTGFHRVDGSGYRLLASQVITLDARNPQVASRLAAAFNPWTRYDEKRRELMKTELERIAATAELSSDVFEIISNALGMDEGRAAA
jgi:aminopeptidase N